jgi:glycosyltransferase involved in cell wall biosynthesis
VAPNGVDQRYSNLPDPPEARRQLGLVDSFTAVYTGQFYRGRGIELMTELARRNPSVTFLWAGGEPEAIDHWRQALSRSGIPNIHLMGFVPNARLPLVQAAGEVLLMPYARTISVSSGGDTAAFASPMKMFEYLAAGRVILSSDLPVLREVLNAENAVLLPPEDPEAWNAALQAVMAQPERAARLAARAREDARRYTWLERARASLAGLEVPDGEVSAG